MSQFQEKIPFCTGGLILRNCIILQYLGKKVSTVSPSARFPGLAGFSRLQLQSGFSTEAAPHWSVAFQFNWTLHWGNEPLTHNRLWEWRLWHSLSYLTVILSVIAPRKFHFTGELPWLVILSVMSLLGHNPIEGYRWVRPTWIYGEIWFDWRLLMKFLPVKTIFHQPSKLN